MNKNLPLTFTDPRTEPSPICQERLAKVGGKAASLEALHTAGFSVPVFEVWTVDRLLAFLTTYGLDACDPMDDAQAETLTTAILGNPLPDEMKMELFDAARRLGSWPLCVRSSGTREDQADLSFAGQYESVLDIHDEAGLEHAVRHCWASMFGPRVRRYFTSHGLSFTGAGMALVIQRFIAPDHAGVTFTVNPITGRQEHLLIEFCDGCGEKLVSGKVVPASTTVDSSTGTVHSGTLPPDMTTQHLHIFRRIHALFGSPQDIEWAMKDGKLWLVQSRPITRIQIEPGIGTWTTADFRDGGVSSSVVTPFMWSLYDFIWQYSMPGYFEIIGLLEPAQKKRPWGGVFFGRPYWNIGEVVDCLLKIPGFHEKNLFSDLGIETEKGYRFRSVPYSPERILAILPTLLKLEKYYAFRISDNKKFRKNFSSLIAPYIGRDLSRLPGKEFAALFRRLIEKVYFKTETSYFFTIYNTSNAKLDFKVRLDALNDAGNDISYIKLISGLLRMKHLAPLKAMTHMARDISAIPGLRERLLTVPSSEIEQLLSGSPEGRVILGAFERLIEQYGFHSSRELDISAPRWDEDRITVWRMLKTCLRDPDPESSISHEKKQHEMYRDEVSRAREAFSTTWHRLVPFEKRLFFSALLKTRSYCWWREEMRDYSSRIYAIIRKFAIEAGRRLKLADGEVFWLTWKQTADALEGRVTAGDVKSLLSRANEDARMYRLFTNPDELGAGFLTRETFSAAAPVGARLTGVGCSSGTIEGIARVVTSLDEVDRIRRGEILVTRFTDPGWTPIFHLLGGVVTETGGVLSHAAVISREFGIPAVLNVPGATCLISDGARIRIDGSNGFVERLS
ncbi:MAG: hypothetical protein HQM09_17995 [Candidatus Riflebacteria bacterium]|nr:hypothetical protein [Candidatus Riflebacteria bacterium]